MEEADDASRLEVMSDEFDEIPVDEEEVEAVGADDDEPDDDSDVEGHLFQRR